MADAHLPLPTEPRSERLKRRLVSIPTYILVALLYFSLSPLLLVLALVVDLIRPQVRGATTRVFVFTGFYLGFELYVMLWVLFRWRYGRPRTEPFLAANYEMQYRFLSGLFHFAVRLFGMKLKCEGLEEAERAPYLMMVRHASLADSVVPNAILPRRFPGRRLRVILKHELLNDPAIDLVGCCIPNAFVRRGSVDTAGAIVELRAQVHGLSEREFVLIFPEGTRFSKGRQARVLEKIEASDPAQFAYARQLKHLLPPRLAGSMALLDEADGALDVVFCTHVGFEGVRTLADFFNGKLVHRTVHIKFWRIPGKDIPKEEEARVAWLYEQWLRADRWVEDHEAAANPS